MTDDEPLAFSSPGRSTVRIFRATMRGWRRSGHGEHIPQPRLADWRRERLSHDVLLLSPEQCAAVETRMQAALRTPRLAYVEIKHESTHVHTVVTAAGCSGRTVRDQLKANATRGLRAMAAVLRRPVWTVGGDWVCVNTEDELERVCLYVRRSQDRPCD